MPKKKVSLKKQKFVSPDDTLTPMTQEALDNLNMSFGSQYRNDPDLPKQESKEDLFTRSYVGFGSRIDILSKEDIANIKFLMSLPQYESLRRFFVLNARDWHRIAGIQEDPHEIRISVRLSKFSEGMIDMLEDLGTKEPPKEPTDSYDIDAEDQGQNSYDMSDTITKAPQL